ncbi:hypothetical protein [Streptomyces sp. NPDC059979]|uniref:hypothetical protein n=1 Tax=Streptomyces sp. NPDC059979 TaxID=3347021 RepID=UPI0036BB6AC6
MEDEFVGRPAGDDGMSAEAVATVLGTTRSKALVLLLTAQDRTGNGTQHNIRPVWFQGLAGADSGPAREEIPS